MDVISYPRYAKPSFPWSLDLDCPFGFIRINASNEISALVLVGQLLLAAIDI